MSESEQQSLDALKTMTDRIQHQVDHYALLGVQTGAGHAEVRDAFFRLAKLLHPDLQVFNEPERKAAVTRAFQAVSSAHNTLSDPHRRAEYDHSLGHAPTPTAPGGGEPNPDLARIYMHRSKQVLQQRAWVQAEDGLRAARELFGPDSDPECDVLLAWAVFNNTNLPEDDRAAESKELLERVIKLERADHIEAQASYYMAIWCKLQGEVPAVRKHLEHCLKLSPRHVDAQRELRLFERRRKNTDARKDRKRRKTGETRRSSRTKTPAAKGHDPNQPAKKVKLQKKKGFLDWLMGK